MFKNAVRLPNAAAVDRRGFLKLSLGTGAGLVIGTWGPGAVPGARAAAPTAAGTFNPFVRITPDNTVVVLVKHLDKGQGAATGLATLVADELDADWAQVSTEFAPADVNLYKNLAFGVQGTGGSTAMANSFEQYRKAGAAARAMIVEAAARAWGIPAADVKVSKGTVTGGGKSGTLGGFAEAAAKLEVPASPALKKPEDFVYIGKSFPRVDQVAKTTGAPIFTQDVRMDGMLIAVVARPPQFGATVKSVDDKAARAVKGVTDVVKVPQGVAVLATTTWAAIQGRNALNIDWDTSKADLRSSDALLSDYREALKSDGVKARRDGDAEKALASAHQIIEAEYVFPFLAHAPMEPMNCVIQLGDGACTIWTGSQMPTIDQAVAGSILGLRPEEVKINTLWAGGSFGRRAVYNADYVAEAAEIAKALGKSIPVKTVWTREDDIKGGYFRPMYVHKVRAGLDKDGNIVGWHHKIAGQSIIAGTAFEPQLVKDGVDGTSVEGVADTPYQIPNMRVDLHTMKAGVPPLWWRSVGHTHTAYVMETMIDELAAVAGKDPVAYRLALLSKHPRHAAVLKLAAEKVGWDTAPPEGITRGVAVHESFQSFVAEVVEARIEGGKPKAVRVVAAVDCGLPINPDNIRAQVEGGIAFGLGAVLYSKVTFKDGRVEQANFNDYEVLRMPDMPKVEVHIVPSTAPPTGIGEPGVPPVGPALANAVAKATGVRVRTLPMSDVKLGAA